MATEGKKEKGTVWSTMPLNDELGEALRAELLGWPGVAARSMMGTLAFFRGKQLLGVYVNRTLTKSKLRWLNRPGEPTLAWVRLRREDAERALQRPGVSKCRLGFAGWIEVPLASRGLLQEAVRWFGHGYEHPAPKAAAGNSKKQR